MTAQNAGTNGWTLQQFLGVTETEMAERMTKRTLKSAAGQDSPALAGWVAKVEGDGVGTELAGHVVGFLQGDVSEIFAGVWSRCAALKTSAAETKGKAGVTELVALASHDFTYSVEPEVEVVVDGVALGSFQFRVELTCTVKALELQVRDGGVAAVRAGECEGSTAVLLAGTKLWAKTLAHVDLPGSVRWKQPFMIA